MSSRIDLATQVRDVRPQRPPVGQVDPSPHPSQQLVVRDQASSFQDQDAQHLVLDRREVYLPALTEHDPCCEIYLQARSFYSRLIAFGLGTPKNGTEARHQRIRSERFRHVAS